MESAILFTSPSSAMLEQSIERDYENPMMELMKIELDNSLNAKRGYGWDRNPWNWVIGFKVI